jgi:WD40 repeat protein
MRIMPALATAALLFAASCGSSGPAPTSTGPRLAAKLIAEWPTTAPPRQAAFSPDGRFLASCDASGLITLRETRTWRAVAKLNHEGGATAVAFNPDGTRLYSGGYDGKVREWDVSHRTLAQVLNGPQKPIWTLDVSRDGARLAAGSEDAGIYLWNLVQPGPPKVLRGHERNVWEVRFSPDGKQLASGSFDRTARLWDAATGKLQRTLNGHAQAVVGLAFSPNGRILATSGDDSTIRFWRTDTGAPLRTIKVGNHTYKLSFSHDGRWLASGGRALGGIGTFWHQLTGLGGNATPVHIWRTADAALIASLPAEDDISNISFSPDQHWLVTSDESNHVRLWRVSEAPNGT